MDPLGFVDGVNLYGYVGDSPVLFFDPTGLERVRIEIITVDELLQALPGQRDFIEKLHGGPLDETVLGTRGYANCRRWLDPLGKEGWLCGYSVGRKLCCRNCNEGIVQKVDITEVNTDKQGNVRTNYREFFEWFGCPDKRGCVVDHNKYVATISAGSKLTSRCFYVTLTACCGTYSGEVDKEQRNECFQKYLDVEGDWTCSSEKRSMQIFLCFTSDGEKQFRGGGKPGIR